MLSEEKIKELWELWERHGTPLDFARAIEAAVLEAQKQEPVCFFNGYYGGRVVVEMLNPRVVYPIGTALYAAPVVSPDMVMVPREPSEAMLEVMAKLQFHDPQERYRAMIAAAEGKK